VFTTPVDALLLILAGAASGALGALLGVGGAIILIPFLVIVIHLPMHHAVATGLVSVIATSTAAAVVNLDRGLVNVRLALSLEIASVAGGIAGGLVAASLPGRALMVVFAILVVAAAAVMWRGLRAPIAPAGPVPGAATPVPAPGVEMTGRLGSAYDDPADGGRVVYRVKRLPLAQGVSLGAGGLSGLLGIGGGIFVVPALDLFCGVPIKAAAATSNFMIGVTAVASAFLYFGRGDVRPAVTGYAVLGIMAGSLVAALINRRIGGGIVRRLFAALLIVVAAQMIWRAFHS
jgi:uncharacterized membrane protein YfcA